MLRALIILSISIMLGACQDGPSSQDAPSIDSASDKLNQWFEVQYEQELLDSPIDLTFQGRKERYNEIDDMSEAAEDRQLEKKRQSVEQMKALFNYNDLDDDAKLSYDLWVYQYEQQAASHAFRNHRYLFHQMSGVHTFFPTFMMQFHKVETLEDMRAYVSRLNQAGRAMNQLIDRAKRYANDGVRAPRFSYEIVLQQSKEIISGTPFLNNDGAVMDKDESLTDSKDKPRDSSLWLDAQNKVEQLRKKNLLDQQSADELLQEVQAALIKSVQPAYENLINFYSADIVNTSEIAQGVHALPKGDAFYRYRLSSMTTTDMSSEEVHQLGLDEVRRIRNEMESLKRKSGFTGSLQEFFAFVRDNKDDPRFYYNNDDEGRLAYIRDASAAIENIKAELPNYFGLLPKADLQVKRVESFREQDGAPQHYYPGTPDGSRPGIYYAHLSDMKAMPKNELEVIAYHEGLPGHHMQISIAQELKGIPTFRTQARFTAYTEGWALYSEALAKEMPNTFSTHYSDFGRLSSEIWRAIRLVVDTGLHYKGWSQQQAVDYFSDNSPIPATTVKAEVRRYLVLPAQATSYKVGMLDIQRLRKHAKTKLGEKFDIRAFHDIILGGGALPLRLLDRKVNAWITDQLNTQ